MTYAVHTSNNKIIAHGLQDEDNDLMIGEIQAVNIKQELRTMGQCCCCAALVLVPALIYHTVSAGESVSSFIVFLSIYSTAG